MEGIDDPVGIDQESTHRRTGGRLEASRRSRMYALSASASTSFQDPADARIPALERATSSIVGDRRAVPFPALADRRAGPSGAIGIRSATSFPSRRRRRGCPDLRTSSANPASSGTLSTSTASSLLTMTVPSSRAAQVSNPLSHRRREQPCGVPAVARSAPHQSDRLALARRRQPRRPLRPAAQLLGYSGYRRAPRCMRKLTVYAAVCPQRRLDHLGTPVSTCFPPSPYSPYPSPPKEQACLR